MSTFVDWSNHRQIGLSIGGLYKGVGISNGFHQRYTIYHHVERRVSEVDQTFQSQQPFIAKNTSTEIS